MMVIMMTITKVMITVNDVGKGDDYSKIDSENDDDNSDIKVMNL